jgi:predicted HicB family RNase H-like nuclease
MSPAGRPPFPPDERRSQKLPVRFSAKELKQVQANAKKAGMSLTAWVRHRLYL